MTNDKENNQLNDLFSARYNNILESLNGDSGNVVIAYNGVLSHEKVNAIAYEVEQKLKDSGEKKGIIKRIFSIIIEALQNIRLHGEKDREGVQHSYVIVARQGEEYKIFTANLLLGENKEKVISKIGKINGFDRPALKEYYMQTLTNGQISDKGGAGLGFITIAMKSKNKLDYDVEPVENGDDLCLFSMGSTVKLKKKK